MVFKLRKIVLLSLGLLTLSSSFAGITDTIHAIKAIEVHSSRLDRYHLGASVHEIDSNTIALFPAESIAGLISENSLASINSYGPGGQASISIRGGGSHHASIIWNGINIQSPMNGGINFSTIPVGFIDKADIQYGGSCTLYGSGTATGSFHMQELLQMNTRLNTEVSSFIGSGHNKILTGKFNYGSLNIGTSLKYFVQRNKGDFNYKRFDNSQSPVEKIKHGGYEQYGISQSNKVRFGENSWLVSNVWILKHKREIPTTVDDYGVSRALQDDNNLMYSLQYNYAKSRFKLKLQSGGFYNQVLYDDPEFNISNDNNSYTLVNLVEASYKLTSGFSFGAILEHKDERANSGSYLNRNQRKLVSGIATIVYSHKNFQLALNMREELSDGKFIPFVFSFGADIPFSKELVLKSQISKNYSLPTFNDLYWYRDTYSSGNPNLVPEEGWSGETGLYFELFQTTYKIKSSAVIFANKISNWIRWLPDSANVWMPQNIQEADSRGTELSFSISNKVGKTQIRFQGRYGYTESIVRKFNGIEMEEGRQMWYVPNHHGIANFSLHYKFLQIGYSHSFTGIRTYDNAIGELPAYHLGNVYFKTTLSQLEKIDFEILFKINNLFNEIYQVRNSWAMPMRNYLIGLNVKFNK